MNTVLPPTFLKHREPGRLKAEASAPATLSPHYEFSAHADLVVLDVFLPGVEAIGVEIIVRGPDLVVVGRKPHPVRVNFAAAHLEHVQHDYELRLRLGRELDYAHLRAELADNCLRLSIPKAVPLATAA